MACWSTVHNTVIVYEPTELQTMDWAQCVGQDKPLSVHGLNTEITGGAAIQNMQARKQALADALFEDT